MNFTGLGIQTRSRTYLVDKAESNSTSGQSARCSSLASPNRRRSSSVHFGVVEELEYDVHSSVWG